MHARRNFYYAAMLVKVKGKPREELNELPEFKALILIDAINDADQPLKEVSPEERQQIRQTVVLEKADAFFDYLKTLDPDDPAYTETFRDAVKYALNHEEKLRRFLDDPMIPIDNGFCLSAGITYPHLLPEGRIKTASTAKRCA